MHIKKRLDQILFEKGYFNSQSESYSSILSGKVFINGQLTDKPGRYYTDNELENLKIIEKQKYVSRGGYKLEKALLEFSINVKNKICMDIGCSTGGFTDCLLRHQAEKVYAVDVGYGQFDYKLRNNNKIILLERTNARYIDKSLIKDKIDIITIDVSFISVRKFLHELISFCNYNYDVILLVKPQFEASRKDVNKGIIHSRDIHIKIIKDLLIYFSKIHLSVRNFIYSPIKGPKGNIEFFFHLKSKGKNKTGVFINRVINLAHKKLLK